MKSDLGVLLQSLHEQTKRVDGLHRDLEKLTTNQHTSQRVAWLTTATILTDDDWAAYRVVFEQVNPGFISTQKALFLHLTLAETRLLFCEKLGLATQEMAQMLGVNKNTIHQTRARLRKRQAATSRPPAGSLLPQSAVSNGSSTF